MKIVIFYYLNFTIQRFKRDFFCNEVRSRCLLDNRVFGFCVYRWRDEKKLWRRVSNANGVLYVRTDRYTGGTNDPKNVLYFNDECARQREKSKFTNINNDNNYYYQNMHVVIQWK